VEMETETLVLTDINVEDELLLEPSMRTKIPPEAADAAREWALARAIGSVPGTAKARVDVLKALAATPPAQLAEAFGRPVQVRAGDPWIARNYDVPIGELAGLLASGVLENVNYVISRDAGRAYLTAWR